VAAGEADGVAFLAFWEHTPLTAGTGARDRLGSHR
jgi:hypothetical protein